MPIDRYRAVCDHHNWWGVPRTREDYAELDADEHRDEYPRPGCMFVEVREI